MSTKIDASPDRPASDGSQKPDDATAISSRQSWPRQSWPHEWAPARHGVDCPKVKHRGDGCLHGAEDDSPYEADGLMYCGRCHFWMGTRP